jgi:tRNA threonylcarbamoyladenosine biosynthesis protein TsaB
MNILAVDTSSKEIAAAVVKNGKCLSEVYIKAEKNYNRMLLSVISDCMDKAHLKPEDIDIFAGTLGPGSFTGIRVGMAALKGLAQPLGKKFYGATVLDIMANTSSCLTDIWTLLDAGRNEFYAAKYAVQNGRVTLLGKYMLIDRDKFCKKIKKDTTVITLKCDNVANWLYSLKTKFKIVELEHVDMKVFAEMAGQSAAILTERDLFTTAPVYIRASAAEENMKKKNKENRKNKR